MNLTGRADALQPAPFVAVGRSARAAVQDAGGAADNTIRAAFPGATIESQAAMTVDFSSVRNFHERAVFEAVVSNASRYPGLAGDAELLADVACVALNRMPSRYMRHEVDFAFYQSDKERAEIEHQLGEAVEFAFGFVQARTAMRARG